MRVAYDAGALIAAERGDERLWDRHLAMVSTDRRPTVSAAVLAQAWRGGPQPRLSRLLRGCDVEPLTESLARLAGRALALSGTHDVVDAAVVVAAGMDGRVVVTSDAGDLVRVAQAVGLRLVFKTV